MARETPISSSSASRPPALVFSRRRRRSTLLAGRPRGVVVLLCCWLLAFSGSSVGIGRVRYWSGGADAADITADLAQASDENSLGLLARACSQYCRPGVGGLDLWVSLQEVRVGCIYA